MQIIKDRTLVLKKVFGGVPIIRKGLGPEDAICYEFASNVRRLQTDSMHKKEFVWTHIANEFAGKMRPVFGAKLKAVGKVTGFPDYIFMWDDGCGCIEFKTEKGRQSEKQKDVESWCEMSGVPYRIARSAEEGYAILRDWGLI